MSRPARDTVNRIFHLIIFLVGLQNHNVHPKSTKPRYYVLDVRVVHHVISLSAQPLSLSSSLSSNPVTTTLPLWGPLFDLLSTLSPTHPHQSPIKLTAQ